MAIIQLDQQSIHQDEFDTNNFVYSFNDKHIIFGSRGDHATHLYTIATNFTRRLDKPQSSQEEYVSATTISDDSSVAATGYSKGSIVVWNLVENTSDARYKLIHQESITYLAFLGNNSRVVIADKNGLITLLSLVQSLTCELVLQTTVINLQKPLTTFESCYPDLIAFASEVGFSVLRVGRRIQVLLDRDNLKQPELCCALSIKDDTHRILVCNNSGVYLSDISDKGRPHKEIPLVMPAPILRCFIFNFQYFILLFNNCESYVFTDDGTIVKKFDNLPKVEESRHIQMFGNNLVFYKKREIIQIPLDLE
ncbi:hypothetical protein TRFO_40367 [Tritrichomonas foetus]|uniref:Uncharacterized protein n=1 Tax=Tritrichomonas foetus TaxID=1144522 RepID=A0A1J4J1D4_9EUKA|nr:hypothetical protein TRFO_40367 [Tritrichomonas foetus]|eukprot:OHS93352.1 hypothetical protein TRFO_40367 [Tritrichomonas foetus]